MNNIQWIHKKNTAAQNDVTSYNDSSIINFDNNKIIFTSEINQASINSLIEHMLTLIVPSKTDNIIYLFIDSPGGTLKDLFKFYDLVNLWRKQYNLKLNTISVGEISSAATLLHILGDPGQRYMMSNAEAMIHELYTSFEGKYQECKSELDDMEDTHSKMIKIYLDHNPKIKKDHLEELLTKTSYMTSQEYIDLGFADAIYTGQ